MSERGYIIICDDGDTYKSNDLTDEIMNSYIAGTVSIINVDDVTELTEVNGPDKVWVDVAEWEFG